MLHWQGTYLAQCPLYAPCKAGGTRPQIGQQAGVSLFNPRIALSYLGNFLLYSRIQQAGAFSVESFGLVGCEEDGATLAGRPRAACLANIHPRWEALLPHICTRLHLCLLGAQCPNAPHLYSSPHPRLGYARWPLGKGMARGLHTAS